VEERCREWRKRETVDLNEREIKKRGEREKRGREGEIESRKKVGREKMGK